MIIKCPNCKTKFKVDDNLIPTEGKKVKCSLCLKTWKTHGHSELSSETGIWIFWILIILITFIIIYIGLIIVFGNKIPIPENLIEILTNLGIPIEGGNLFGRSYNR